MKSVFALEKFQQIIQQEPTYTNFCESELSWIENRKLDWSTDRIRVGVIGVTSSGKSTLIKIINRLLTISEGELLIDGKKPGPETKAIVSYLPERTYLNRNRKVREYIDYFSDFYHDFDRFRAESMLQKLGISSDSRIKTLSKGTQEKIQLVLVMSRRAKLYCLDEPIAGVDPAARDYILNTIINNYDENATILISTHLIADIENILDEVIFIQNGRIRLYSDVDSIRVNKRMSIDGYFREVFRC